MKRIITSLFVASILLTPASALGQPIQSAEDLTGLFKVKVSAAEPTVVITTKREVIVEPVEPKKPEPVVYTVVKGDNLSKIGTANNVEWQRLWAKNTQLTHPDVIQIDDKITVPLPDEVLQRDLPAVVALPVETPGVQPYKAPAVATAPPVYQAPAASYGGGNTYDYGYCTWYVKNKRGGSLPNGLGNANTWYSRAASQGMAVGSTPRAGAVGTSTRGEFGHVIYVESVNGDGTINISEMNYKGFGITSSRTTKASEFVYIY